MAMPETYTVKQVGEILQLSDEQIRRMFRENILPGIKLGNEWRVRTTTLHLWMDEQEGKKKEE